MGGCGWLWLFKPHLGSVYFDRIYLWVDVGVCKCLKHIYGWVYLSRRHFWMGVTVYMTFIGGSDCLKYIHGSVCLLKKHTRLGVTVKSTLRMGVTACDWCG